jgi:hypothetical protein
MQRQTTRHATPGSYSPFQGLGGDVAQIASLGYTYSAGRPIVGRASDDDLIRRRRRPWLRAASDEAMDMDMDMDDEAELDAVVGGGGGRAARIATTGGTVNSRGGKAAVQYALEQWTRNYTGYAWSLRLQEFDQHQMDKVRGCADAGRRACGCPPWGCTGLRLRRRVSFGMRSVHVPRPRSWRRNTHARAAPLRTHTRHKHTHPPHPTNTDRRCTSTCTSTSTAVRMAVAATAAAASWRWTR